MILAEVPAPQIHVAPFSMEMAKENLVEDILGGILLEQDLKES